MRAASKQSRTAPVAHGAPPILVVGGTLDPAAPYEWSQALADELESGVLLTREGMGHVTYEPCTVDTISRYLVELQIPPEGTVCPAR